MKLEDLKVFQISKESYEELKNKYNSPGIKLNNYINSIGQKQ